MRLSPQAAPLGSAPLVFCPLVLSVHPAPPLPMCGLHTHFPPTHLLVLRRRLESGWSGLEPFPSLVLIPPPVASEGVRYDLGLL